MCLPAPSSIAWFLVEDLLCTRTTSLYWESLDLRKANRLQRWALTLLQYDFKLEFKSTESFGYADVLSRLIGEHSKPDEDYIIASVQLEADIKSMQAESVAVFPVTHQMIQQGTKQDKVLQCVMQYLRASWTTPPDSGDLQCFFKRRESLSEADGCLMFLDRMVVPQTLQNAVLKQLHAGHPGMQRMKSIARSYVYWPNIDTDIEDFVRKCSDCAAASKAPVKTTLSSWVIPSQPWTRPHMDYAGPIQGRYFLTLTAVDAYSKWPEIFATTNSTATTTIRKFHECVARFGCPQMIVTDNGTQFDSEIFKQFCGSLGIEHVRTPPYHPQSNGQAERFVDTLKRALSKLGEKNVEEALQTFLQTYRYTPNPTLPNNISPAEALLGRKVRTVFDLMRRPKLPVVYTNEKQNAQFNKKHGAKQRSFAVGEEVYAEIHIRNEKYWAKGVIIEQKGNVVYNVLLEDQRRQGLIRSHANQLRRRTSSEATPVQENTLPVQVRFPAQPDVGELEINDRVVQQAEVQPQPLLDAPGPSRLCDMADDQGSGSSQRSMRKSSTPFRDPSSRKRRLPSHFEYYEIY